MVINNNMNDSIKQFKKRNRKRNSHLYNDDMVIGYDYVICPESNERLSMIKKNYIERVLRMSPEKYKALYPEVQYICKKRISNIKKGLKRIDQDTGLTKHQLGINKAKITLSQIDENGMRGYDRLGQKTRNTHISNIDEYGLNGYNRIAKEAIKVGLKTRKEKGMLLTENDKTIKYRFKCLVTYLTHNQNKKLYETTKYRRTHHGGDGTQIDHIFSTHEGFIQCVCPYILASKFNLKEMDWKENAIKSSKCNITKEKLLTLTNRTIKSSTDSYNIFLKLLQEDIDNDIPMSTLYVLERHREAV